MRRLEFNNDAQTSLDFLAGVTIFMLAFIFVFAFIPGMFAPFHSNSDELTMTADRVAAELVDNSLAINNSSTKLPGILDLKKVDDFKFAMKDPDNKTLRSNLGLNGSGRANNIEVIIKEQNGSTIIINNGETPGMENVGQSKRFVMVRSPTGSGAERYPGINAIVTVRVW